MNRLHRSIRLAVLAGVLGSSTVWAECPSAPTLKVSDTRSALSLKQLRCLESQSTLHSLLQGEAAAVYWSGNIARHMHTAIVPRRLPTRALETELQQVVADVQADSGLGHLSLTEFLSDPRSGARGFVVVHRGKVVFEQYPGMRESDSHLWASNAKPMASLLVDLLINDGVLDQSKTMGEYLPDFRGTAWESVRLIDVLDMTPGLDTEESSEAFNDPDSIAIRTFLAEMGEPRGDAKQAERILDILKQAKRVRDPGTQFEYGSPVTQALVLLTEQVANKRWSDLFDERVWSKMYVEGDLQVHLAPDGTAAAHGVVSSRLRDMARFAMLYTPSWDKVASERIVSPEMITRIRAGARSHDFFMRGDEEHLFTKSLNDRIEGNSRQWDAVFADGDFFKAGLMGQGIYVSPNRDLVIAYFSINSDEPIHRYARPIAKLFKAAD